MTVSYCHKHEHKWENFKLWNYVNWHMEQIICADIINLIQEYDRTFVPYQAVYNSADVRSDELW